MPIVTTSQLGLSENSVPLHPMVNDHYPYQMAIIGVYPIFRHTQLVQDGAGSIHSSPAEKPLLTNATLQSMAFHLQ